MAGPFSSTTFNAVAACTRALSGSDDADAALASVDAATLGSLRAHADRMAVRRRFHDAAVHERNRPDDPAHARLFDVMELARLDALGAGWLSGISKNLLAHPGAEDDGLRWLAFESLSGSPAPAIKAAAVARVRQALPKGALAALAQLARLVPAQPAFSASSAEWIRDAARHVPPQLAETAAGSSVALPTRTVVRHLPRRGDPGATSAPLGARRQTGSTDEGDGAGSGANIDPSGVAGTGYRPYTTAYDRVVNAAMLASRSELEDLRTALNVELTTIRTVIARLAKRLLRVLMARQTREWRFDLEEGVLDASRLAPLIASKGAAKPFKDESESRFPGTVVTLLIDHSGSMRGRPMRIAALTVEIFARVLERCGVRCEVLGFTTRDWDGGQPAKEWASDGYPEHPGRLNALEHIVIKSADVPWRRARAGLGLCLRDEMLKENIDGEAVTWAHGRLLARPEPRRILVVVSDGTPMDEATMAANGHEYLESHLQTVIDGIEGRSPVQLAAIGIGHDVSAFYANATKIARIDDLGPALGLKLMMLLGDDTAPVSRKRRRGVRL